MNAFGVDTVSQIQSRIAEMVGPQRYKIWFKNSTELSLMDGFLKVGVPNVFVGTWIENHFADTITEAAREVTGNEVQVAYAIDPKIMGQLRKRQLDAQAIFIQKNTDRFARNVKRTGIPAKEKALRGRFETFVEGPGNRMALSAAHVVADAPGRQFNPLFIHGGCGLGKTHLLQAIYNHFRGNTPECKIRYITGEGFTNQFVYAIKSLTRDAFRNEFRSLDVLLIDDVHFLANKKATQEEFLHTFNHIDAKGKQVVLVSDAHPKMIGDLSESLVTRFVSGMVVKIEPPDFKTRCEILRKHAERMSRTIPDGVIEYIAENIRGNVRELEGALIKLAAFSSVSHQPITVPVAKHALHDHLLRTAPIIQLSDIESIVGMYFGLTPADLHTSRKTRTIALARGVAMYLARKHTEMSFPEIGRFMGNKNHSTVILACRRLDRVLTDEGQVRWNTPSGEKRMSLRDLLDELEEQLGKKATPSE